MKHKVYIEVWDSLLANLIDRVPIIWEVHSTCLSNPNQCQEACHAQMKEEDEACII
jgi:hypothetical protein